MDKNALPKIVNDRLCLEASTYTHFSKIRSWFKDGKQIQEWAGSSFDFPASDASFTQQLNTPGFTSLSLMHDNYLVGFGQFQLHPPFLHLGRLTINPKLRSKGLAHVLLRHLIDEGSKTRTIKTVSLFVYESNEIAYRVYKKAGFVKCAYPLGKQKIQGCDYLVLRT